MILLLTFLAPVLIDPLFHTFTPLKDADLKARVLRLAERAGIPVEQVLETDASRRTVKANAYVTGFGRTKRIVLYDTLVERASADEVEVVLAHEIGHRMYHHIWKGVGLSVSPHWSSSGGPPGVSSRIQPIPRGSLCFS
jgi:STE24 endopeptidase